MWNLISWGNFEMLSQEFSCIKSMEQNMSWALKFKKRFMNKNERYKIRAPEESI